jgi:signal transduction histidine kinase
MEKPLISAITSNTKLQQLEEALLESRSLALAGQFAAFIMHEVNGSLEAVANLVYLIGACGEDPEQVRNYSQLLEEQVGVLLGISRQTLSFYHSNETTEAISIASIAEAALRIHRDKVVAKEIRLLKQLPENVVMEGHAGAMLQVFSNLIGNAVEALPPRGTLQLRARRLDGEAHIVVADNGHGIPAAVQPRIFDPFFTTKREHGTGLGLAITKAIVERHRGRIRTRTSTRDGMSGTAFRICLPLHRNKSAH